MIHIFNKFEVYKAFLCGLISSLSIMWPCDDFWLSNLARDTNSVHIWFIRVLCSRDRSRRGTAGQTDAV